MDIILHIVLSKSKVLASFYKLLQNVLVPYLQNNILPTYLSKKAKVHTISSIVSSNRKALK